MVLADFVIDWLRVNNTAEVSLSTDSVEKVAF
jgi:hypothetical protein